MHSHITELNLMILILNSLFFVYGGIDELIWCSDEYLDKLL